MNIYQSNDFSIFETANMEDGSYTVRAGYQVYCSGFGTLEHDTRGTLTTTETYVHLHVFQVQQDAADFAERVTAHGKINTELWEHTGSQIKGDNLDWATAEWAERERSDELGR
tara:strand:- start:1317 stop:1655 length:339 start_codon:yes stop_codon:yes gene_type:complete